MSELTEVQHRDWLAAHAELVLKEVGVREGHHVLDFGCGGGAFAIPAGQLVGAEGVAYGADMEEARLAEVAQRARRAGLANVTTINTGGGVALALEGASCDVALLFDMLQMVEDWAPLFAELYRVLRPEGRLSVFPMHVDGDDVRRGLRAAGFAETPAWRCLLGFTR